MDKQKIDDISLSDKLNQKLIIIRILIQMTYDIMETETANIVEKKR